jgi:hypothetical protein
LKTTGAFGIELAPWAICSSRVAYVPSGANMVPLYQNFQKQKPGFKVLVYSGSVDIATVPHSTTSPCLFQVSSAITSPWQPFFVNGQTAGYWEATKLYTHAMVKGAGHGRVENVRNYVFSYFFFPLSDEKSALSTKVTGSLDSLFYLFPSLLQVCRAMRCSPGLSRRAI